MASFPDDFLLASGLAGDLYREAAGGLPLVDYHGHLDARELLENRPYPDPQALWVAKDPYKHRCMRMAGVPEAEITGGAGGAREKFRRWAETLPRLIGHPVWIWSGLELDRFFGVREPLDGASCGRVWDRCRVLLAGEDFLPRRLIERAGVEALCTSDPWLADLDAHAGLARSGWRVAVLPSLRGDDAVAFGREDHPGWIGELGAKTGRDVASWEGFTGALAARLDAFGELGCRLADHALDGWSYEAPADRDPGASYGSYLRGDRSRCRSLAGATLFWLGTEYARRGWTLQLHLNALRATSGRLRRFAGPAGGYAGMGDPAPIRDIAAFLDDMESGGRLPRVIFYSLNPVANAALATLAGSFAEDGVAGKVQLGPPWWYNDHAEGLRQHFDTLASLSLLGTSAGMTTDARSPLSMVRHDVFRRALCSWIAERILRKEWPDDRVSAARLIRAVAYDNPRALLRQDPSP